MSYGLAAWGQAAKTHLQKLLVLQKCVLNLMYFSEPRAQSSVDHLKYSPHKYALC